MHWKSDEIVNLSELVLVKYASVFSLHGYFVTVVFDAGNSDREDVFVHFDLERSPGDIGSL